MSLIGDDVQFPLAVEVGFDGLYGLVIDGRDERHVVRAHVDLEPRHLQPFGIVHGGLLAAIAESITSVGTFWAHGGRKAAMGQSNQTSFLRPVTGPVVRAVATPRHQGRTTWVWEVDLTDAEGRLCALVRMTIAVRDLPDPARSR